MTRKTKLKINIIFIIILVLILTLSMFMIMTNNTLLFHFGALAVIVLFVISILIGNALSHANVISDENKVKKCIKTTYSKLEISDLSDIPLCIKVALDENNITFYGKYVITKKGDTIVHVVAKKDDQFFTEEILTEKGPMFLTCNEFLNTFEV